MSIKSLKDIPVLGIDALLPMAKALEKFKDYAHRRPRYCVIGFGINWAIARATKKKIYSINLYNLKFKDENFSSIFSRIFSISILDVGKIYGNAYLINSKQGARALRGLYNKYKESNIK